VFVLLRVPCALVHLHSDCFYHFILFIILFGVMQLHYDLCRANKSLSGPEAMIVAVFMLITTTTVCSHVVSFTNLGPCDEGYATASH